MGKVVPFPRAIIIEGKIRSAERRIATQLDHIENCDPNAATLQQRVTAVSAPLVLEMAQEDLRKALAEREMLSAVDLMQYRGVAYRAQPSQNGGH